MFLFDFIVLVRKLFSLFLEQAVFFDFQMLHLYNFPNLLNFEQEDRSSLIFAS